MILPPLVFHALAYLALFVSDKEKRFYNIYCWMDQLNGIFSLVSIGAKLAAFLLPFPVASLTGSRSCTFIDLCGRLYLAGASVWSCYIGIYRVLYIKAQVIGSVLKIW